MGTPHQPNHETPNKKEIWKPVPDYEGVYSISSLGNVRCNIDRFPRKTGELVKQRPHNYKKPEYGTKVSLSKDGVQHSHLVHILFAKAFLGEPPDRHIVIHNDGDRTNNVLGNVKYGLRTDPIASFTSAKIKNGWKELRIDGIKPYVLHRDGRICPMFVNIATKYKPNRTTLLFEKDGRKMVALARENGGSRLFTYDRLYASAFIGEVGPDDVVWHADGDLLNYAPGNVKIVKKDYCEPADVDLPNGEDWLPVYSPDFSQIYKVSSNGNVFCCAKGPNRHPGVIKSSITKTGYQGVTMKGNGKQLSVSVHRLVALAFIPNLTPDKTNTVNHKNGIRHDNRVENLEWMSMSENMEHANRELRKHRWEPQSQKTIEVINMLRKSGKTVKYIAEALGVLPNKVEAWLRDQEADNANVV